MKNILILFLVIVILIGGYIILTKNNNNNSQNNSQLPFDQENVDIQIRDMSSVPAKYFSGNSRFSYGSCQKDSDCSPIGCSLEMCSSDPNLMTTCELGADFPNPEKYACGCIVDTCGWYLK